MFKFHFIRSMRDIYGHIILILLPVFLIGFFNFINSNSVIQTSIYHATIPLTTVLTIGFALTFQIYGASISFENLGADFFSPMHDRLLATPTEPRKIVLSNIGTGILVSSLQTLAIFGFSAIVLHTRLTALPVILAIMLLSIIFNHLFGTVILLLSRSVKTANMVITLYGAIVPMTIGLYFPLPDNAFFSMLRTYLTPMALANTAILGAIEQNTQNILVATAPLALLTIALFMGLKPLLRKVAV
jgi:ABC-2 type transport system permease protein